MKKWNLPEANPIFRLEMRKARHGGVLGVTVMLGGLLGIFLFLSGHPVFTPVSRHCINVLLPSCALFGLPFYFGRGMARQRQSEDLILSTDLSSTRILLGKFYAVLVLTSTLFLPILMGRLFSRSSDFSPPLVSYFALSICFSLVAIGYMAGARNTTQTLILAFLVLVHLASGGIIVFHIIFSFTLIHVEFPRAFGSSPSETILFLADVVEYSTITLFLVLSSLIAFLVGKTFLSGPGSKFRLHAGLVFTTLFVLFGLLLVFETVALSIPGFIEVFLSLLMCACYMIAPLYSALSANRKKQGRHTVAGRGGDLPGPAVQADRASAR